MFAQSILTVEYKCHGKILLQFNHDIPHSTVCLSFGLLELYRVRQLPDEQDSGALFKDLLPDFHVVRSVFMAVYIS